MSEGVKYTPEQDENMGSRTLHDADLIKGGAKFENGILQPTESQIGEMKDEMDKDQHILTDEEKADGIASNNVSVFLTLLTAKVEMQEPQKIGDLSKEQLDSFFQEAVKRLGFGSEINDRNNASRLQKLIIDNNSLFQGVFREAASFTLSGQEVEVKRTSGEVEKGWKVENYDMAHGLVNVNDLSRGIFKAVPLYEFAMLNSALFQK